MRSQLLFAQPVLNRMRIKLRVDRWLFAVAVATSLFVASNHSVPAQNQIQLPAPTDHISDFAGVLDGPTKTRLDSLLKNLKSRTRIDFYVTTVESTGGQDIFDFSRQLARDWNLGYRTSVGKSLLLVVSADSKTSFTQFSKAAQNDLPEGVLGEMSQKMRTPLAAGRFGEAVEGGVLLFVSSLAQKVGFTIEEIDPQSRTVAESSSTAPTEPATTPTINTSESDAEKTRPRVVRETAAPLTEKPAKTVAKKTPKPGPKASEPASKTSLAANTKTPTPTSDADEEEEVELTFTKPLAERPAILKAFIETHPNSKSRPRAIELLISTHASLGDLKLKNGDSAGGVEQLMLAISESEASISDNLFSGVVSQIPMNLYLRGEKPAAFKAASEIESKFGSDPKRLLAVAVFYLGIERGDEAARVGEMAVKLAPDMAEAHRVMAVGLHFTLRLDEAAAEYKRALELDPTLNVARGSLADLNRASGKPEEALALYNEQLKAEPKDRAARAGIVLALMDLGRRDEANTALDAALVDEPRNLPLLSGVAYWMAAHDESEKALDYARKSVAIEPRYTWAQIALARSLLGLKRPIDAERSMRYARQYGKFPTLNYELASVLSYMGLYEEAAEVLLESFAIKEGRIETQLAGRIAAHDDGFLDLLAPERRASIFQVKAADTATNARQLKGLLELHTALNQEGEVNETLASTAAKEFASGNDNMLAFRQMYAASRLVRKRVALKTALELVEEAKSGTNAALEVPAVTMAVQADEFRELRARAISAGNIPDVADAPRSVMSNMLKGKLEDLTGWILFNQDKLPEAIDQLKLAENTIPTGTPAWRNALWHLGVVYEQSGRNEDALNYYIKSYSAGDPDPIRRPAIEQLYRKMNGSLDGLDQRIGAAAVANYPAANTNSAAATPTPTTTVPEASPETKPSSSETLRPVSSDPAKLESVKPEKPETATVVPAESTTTRPPAVPESQPTTTPDEDPMKAAAARVRSTIKITGRVVDADKNGIGNVAVVLISPSGSVLASTTNNDGNYSFTVTPSQKTYRIIPSKDGYVFAPIDKVLPGVHDDQKEVDFVGNRTP